MPVVFISDGILYNKNIFDSEWDENRLTEELLMLGITDYTKVFLAFCDGSSKLHVFMHGEDDQYANEVTK